MCARKKAFITVSMFTVSCKYCICMCTRTTSTDRTRDTVRKYLRKYNSVPVRIPPTTIPLVNTPVFQAIHRRIQASSFSPHLPFCYLLPIKYRNLHPRHHLHRDLKDTRATATDSMAGAQSPNGEGPLATSLLTLARERWRTIL